MKNKKRHLREYSIGISLLFFMLIIAINILAGAIQDKWALSMDLSANRLTEFSPETIEVLQGLDQNVSIYLLFQNNTKSELRINLEEILARYRTGSRFVTVQTVDPITEPGIIKDLLGDQEALSEGSMIVTNADHTRVRLIDAHTLFDTIQDGSGRKEILFNGESYLTSALMYVTSSDMPRVYFLTGHDEIDMDYCQTIVKQLKTQNYQVSDLSLQEGILEPEDLVIVVCAEKDLFEAEYEILRDWIQSGGRLFYAHDPSISMENMPLFAKLLSYFQVSFEEGFVVEDELATTSYLSTPTNIIPLPSDESRITSPMHDKRVLLPKPGAVKMPSVSVSGFTARPLLTTSAKSFLKRLNSNTAITERSESDRTGSFPLAMSVISQPDYYDESKDIRIVAINSIATIVDSQYLNASDNALFTLNAINWLVNRQEDTPPEPKTLASMTLTVPNEKVLWRIAGFVVLTMPVLLAVVGTTVWLIRRKR